MQMYQYTPIHFNIKNGYTPSLERSLNIATSRDINRVFVFWNPLEYAKLHLNIAKCFYPERINTAQRIYELVRDYTLFHAISYGNLKRVKSILQYDSKNFDLNRKLAVRGITLSLYSLAQIGRNSDSKNGKIIFTILLHFFQKKNRHKTFDV
jgi:hypothetical protein